MDEYAETLLARQISTLEGVAQVSVFGSAKYAVRIQADPDALAARKIGIDTLVNAVSAANVNLATGALNGPTRSTVIHTGGQLNNAAEFNDQVVAYQNGAPVRLKDVGRAIDGLENPYGQSWYKDQPAIVLAIFRQPGSNGWGDRHHQEDPAAVRGQPAAVGAAGRRVSTAARSSAPRSTMCRPRC